VGQSLLECNETLWFNVIMPFIVWTFTLEGLIGKLKKFCFIILIDEPVSTKHLRVILFIAIFKNGFPLPLNRFLIPRLVEEKFRNLCPVQRPPRAKFKLAFIQYQK